MSDETAPAFEYKNFKKFLRANAGEEGEDDARSACPFDTLGYTRDTMDITTRCNEVIRS